MLDPLHIEADFQNLKHLLELTGSSRMRLLHLAGFLEPMLVPGGTSYLHAYWHEIFPAIRRSIHGQDLKGTNPAFLLRIRDILTSIDGSINQQTPQEESIPSMLQQLQDQADQIKQSMAWRATSTPGTSRPRASLPSSIAGDTQTVWVPLIEREPLLFNLPPAFGTLRQLRVEASFERKGVNEDRLEIHGSLQHGADQRVSLAPLVMAARDAAKRFSRHKSSRHITARCSLHDPAYLVGDSLQAPLVALLICECLRLCEHREQFSISPFVAITGKVTEDGHLTPVDQEGLRHKVEACYFSWIQYLVVPSEQATVCRELAEQLAGQHLDVPALEVMGISRVDEILYDRRLTTSQPIPIAMRTARKAWKQRVPIAAAAMLIMGFILFRDLFGPFDKNPVQAEFKGNSLIVKNKLGEVVGHIPTTSKTVEEINGDSGGDSLRNWVRFSDVDGDSINEAVWAEYATEKAEERINEVRCWSLKRNEQLWEWPTSRALNYPQRTDISGDSYMYGIIQVEVGDPDAPGIRSVYVLVQHPQSFPGVLVRLDGLTGKEISHYLNSGVLRHMQFVDLEPRDGKKELLTAGVNNSYNLACLVALDPDHFSGQSPSTEKYREHSEKTGGELAYLLLPRTMAGEVLGDSLRYNDAGNIILEEGKAKRISIKLTEGNNQVLPDVYCWLDFDFALHLNHISTSSNYDQQIELWLRQGKITHRPDNQADLEEYKKKIQYWNGTDFQTTPFIRKRE